MRGRASSLTSNQRLWILTGVLALWASGIFARLYWLQVYRHPWLAQRAEHQQQQTVAVNAERGLILDRNLHPLAMSLAVDSVCAEPDQVADRAAEAAPLAAALRLDAGAVAARLAEPKAFVWVARQVTADQAAAVRALDLPGICFRRETRRFYPEGNLAANLLGFVGTDGNGLGGVELSFDPALRGHDGVAVMQVDARQNGYDRIERAMQPGANVILTLDNNIQYIAQGELDRRVSETHAQRGIAIVEDPRTGAILAMAVSPAFNPNDYADAAPERLGNPAVSEVYEPGSVFKLVTISAALQEGVVHPDDPIDCAPGTIWVGGKGKAGRLIHDHKAYGTLSVSEVLQNSSDVGAIKIGEKLGNDRFYQFIQAYGFGQPTGIKLPGESRGLARPPRLWSPVSIGAVSIGQEIAVTPLQVIALISTLANGGVYHAPRVVTTTGAGPAPTDPPEFVGDPGRRVVSPEVANEMKEMMERVVLAGTAKEAQLNGYTAAGKTGTAQKVDPGTHLYSASHYIASFGGFAPVNDPAVSILVVVDSPAGAEHQGGPIAGPVFKSIAERVLPYLGITPDVPGASGAPALSRHAAGADALEESEQISDGSVLSEADAASPPGAPAAAKPAEKAAAAAPVKVVVAAPPAPAPGRGDGEVVVLSYGSEDRVAVPDFSGRTVRAVTQMCQQRGLVAQLQGSGTARTQFPAAGAMVSRGSKVSITFGY